MRTILSAINLKSTKEYPKPTYLTISPAPAYPNQVAERSRTEPPYNLKSTKTREKQGSCAESGEMGCKGGGDGGLGVGEVEGWKDGNERGEGGGRRGAQGLKCEN